MVSDRLFIPISKATVDGLLSENIYQGDTHTTLETHEVAALVLLNELPNLQNKKNTNMGLEKHLANLLLMGNTFKEKTQQSFIHDDQVRQRLESDKILTGLSILDDRDIYLMPEKDVKQQRFLHADGSWFYEFKVNYQHPDVEKTYIHETRSGEQQAFRTEQFRILQTLLRNVSDEHSLVEAVAGSGKTLMTVSVAEKLLTEVGRYKRVYALAYSRPQADAMRIKLPKGVIVMTFGEYAKHIIRQNYPEGVTNTFQVGIRDYAGINYSMLAKFLHMLPMKDFQPYSLARAVLQTVAAYCRSSDEFIGSHHLPKWLGQLSPDQMGYLVGQASTLWELTLNPPKNLSFDLPIRDHHLIKFVAINKLPTPESVGHIIVDESHDISQAMMQLIENGTQTFTGLGDKYQAIHSQPGARKATAIERTLPTSYRVPRGFDPLVNAMLDMHPITPTISFQGNRERKKKVTFYDAPIMPDEPTAIWVEDEWELFEWVERLVAAGRTFSLVGHIKALDDFVKGCLQLFQGKKPPNVIPLANYNDWDSIKYKLPMHRSFNHIDTLLRKGYNLENWKSTLKHHDPKSGFVIGLFQHSRNREFQRVMLAPAILRTNSVVLQAGDSQSEPAKRARRSLASRLYLGATRTTHELILPASFEDIFQTN